MDASLLLIYKKELHSATLFLYIVYISLSPPCPSSPQGDLQGFARPVGGTPSSKLALRVHLLLPSVEKSYKSLINAFILPFLRSPKFITSAPHIGITDTRALNLN